MENKTFNATIIVRGGTTAEWQSANPTPAMREICAEYRTDGSFDLKIGDGTTPWNSLPYVSTHELADLIDDATHRTVTDAEKATWNAKQNALRFDNAPTSGSNNPVTSGGVASALQAKADKSEIPDVSAFITNTVGDLVNYYTKTVIDGKIDSVNAAISAIPKFAIKVVTQLPTSEISATTVYLLKTSTTESGNLYTEYIYIDNAWESLGTQELDLSNYATKSYVTTSTAGFMTTAQVNNAINTALTPYAKTANLAIIADTGSLADAKQDDTHRTVTDKEKETWNAKQDALKFDTEPDAKSTNPITSSGVAAALLDVRTFAATKADKSAIVNTSTGLTDSATLARYTDTVIINGGGV